MEFEDYCEVCFKDLEQTPPPQAVHKLSEILEKAMDKKFIQAYYTYDSIVATI